MESADLRDELLCSICQSIYTYPVTLSCGHNFCRDCIEQHLNTQDEYGDYSCPECRAKTKKRPELKQNTTLRNIAERVQSTHPRQVVITGICCTYCIQSPVLAVRSCLHCEASLCDNHLRVHNKGPEHVLTDPSTSLEKRKCSVHKKILEYYCTEDRACICVSCRLDGEHQGHEVEMLDEASEKKKKKLRNVLQKLTRKREETEEIVQSLEERWREAQEKASGEAKRVTVLFIDIRRRLDDLEKRILSDISRQEMKVSLPLSVVIHKMGIQKDELSRKMRDIEDLCNMTDPLTVLQGPDTGDLYDTEEGGGEEDTGGHDKTHDEMDQGVKLNSHITHILSDIIKHVNTTFYGEGPADILLDVNTAANNILISDDLKTATKTEITQNRPETPERFQDFPQVMSRRRFTSGQHYWDVEIRGSGLGMMGMCYPSIDRRGDRSLIGNSNKSWCLCIRLECNNQCSVIHDANEIHLPQQISSGRVRMCLDYSAGRLSFYELCVPIRHLHTFTSSFTEPLHAMLYLWGDFSEKLEGTAMWNIRM